MSSTSRNCSCYKGNDWGNRYLQMLYLYKNNENSCKNHQYQYIPDSGYYRNFLRNFASIIESKHLLLSKNCELWSFFFLGTRDESQDFVLARQALFPLS